MMSVGILSNMKAEALAQERHVIAEDAFVEIVVWRVPRPIRGSTHRFKYRLALVVAGECVLRYDNETGKGDHRHVGDVETAYSFSGYEKLLADFWAMDKRVIITTHLPTATLGQLFDPPLVSRILGLCQEVPLKGPDRRVGSRGAEDG